MNKLSKKIKGNKYFSKYYKQNLNNDSKTFFPDKNELNERQRKIKEINLVLLDFQFKKATRQPIKPHEAKKAKKEKARLITQYWQLYHCD
jgi:ribosomal protein L29